MNDEIPEPDQTLFGPPVSDMTMPGGGAVPNSIPNNLTLNAPPRPGIAGRLDGFEIIRQLGAGGMGVVLLARNSAMDALVAIKLLRPEMAHDSRIVHRFLIEARHMYRMSHPHILKVLDVRERPEGPYYVMPYLKRGPLSGIMRPGEPLDPTLTLSVCRQVADALAYAHGQGVIHRDLKPANVLLDEQNRAYLSDFGLVRTVFNDSIVDIGASQCEGTAAYMSPAVAAGQAEDTRCDIYSFGAMLYELLTGEPPYTGRNTNIVLQQILAGPPTPILKRVPTAPSRLAAIATHAMARELRDRYASMSDVAADLERVARGEAPIGPHGRAPRKKTDVASSRGVGRAFAVGLAIAAIATGAFWITHRRPTAAEALNGAPSHTGSAVAPETGMPAIASIPTPQPHPAIVAIPSPVLISSPAALAPFGSQSETWRLKKPGLIRTLQGHPKPSYRLAFLAGDSLLSCAATVGDYSIRLWDIAKGNEGKRIDPTWRSSDVSIDGRWVFANRQLCDMANGAASEIQGAPYDWKWVKVAPDGMHVVFAVPNGTKSLDLWVFDQKLPSGSQKKIASGPSADGMYSNSSFSADGKFFLLESDNDVTVYDADTWTAAATRTRAVHGASQRYDLISPDGRTIFFADNTADSNTAVLWDWKSGHDIKVAADKALPKIYLFSPDGRWILTRRNSVPTLWNVESGAQVATLKEGGDNEGAKIESAAFTPNGKCVLTGHADGALAVWDVAAGRRITTFVSPITFDGQADSLGRIVISPDGLLAAASAGHSGDIAVWRLPDDTNSQSPPVPVVVTPPASPLKILTPPPAVVLPADTGQFRLIDGHKGPVGLVTFSPDGRRILSTGTDMEAIWDVQTGLPRMCIDDAVKGIHAWGFAPETMVSISDDWRALLIGKEIWDPQVGRVRSLVHDGDPQASHISGDGRHAVAFFHPNEAHCAFWEIPTGKQSILPTFSGTGTFNYSPDGHYLACDASMYQLIIINTETGSKAFEIAPPLNQQANAFGNFSDDSRLIVSRHCDDSVRITEVSTGKEIRRLEKLEKHSWALLAPDGKKVVTGNNDGAKIWDVASGKPLATLEGSSFASGINRARYTPDGSRIVAACYDRSVGVWDAQTGRQLARWMGHSNRINWLCVSNDGQMAATAGEDKSIRLWRLPQALAAAAIVPPKGPDAPLNTLTDAERAAGWTLLFDGKTTAGWRGYNRIDVPPAWKVVDGALTTPGTQGGDLITDQQFIDFELEIDWKIGPGGNSGVMFHGVEGSPIPYHTAPQCQLLDNAGHGDGKVPTKQSGSCYGVYPPTKDATKPLLEWNHLRLVVKDNHVEHWINGEKVCEYVIGSEDWKKRIADSHDGAIHNNTDLGASNIGPIDLEDWSGEVAFRNIKIRKISDAVPNTLTEFERAAGWKLLFDGKTTAGWRGYKQADVPSYWTVVDGAITAPGNRGLDVVSAETYSDFELQLEWKIAAGGNSGVLFHVTEDHAKPYDSGPEFQLLDNDRHSDGSTPRKSAGSCFDLYAPSKDATKPVGQWNQLRLIVNHNHAEHWLNGEKVCQYTIGGADWNAKTSKRSTDFAQAADGLIDLQNYDKEIAFRSIKIRKLSTDGK